MTRKYYAVKKGRQTGIYTSWPECQKMVSGFPGAVYRSFVDRPAAENWLNSDQELRPHQANEQLQLKLDERSFAQQAPDTTSRPTILLYTDGGSRNHGNRLRQHGRDREKGGLGGPI